MVRVWVLWLAMGVVTATATACGGGGDGDGSGDGDGGGDGDGDDASAGRPGGDGDRPDVTGGVGDACDTEDDCPGVRYPECVDLTGEGQNRCQSVCEQPTDCSADADCIASGDAGGVCLLPCQAAGDCPGAFACVRDQLGVGYCIGLSGLINDPCTTDAECSSTYGLCYDWGDGTARCSGACLDHVDCGGGDNLCVEVDPNTGDALCFQECTEQADCPSGWACEEATTSGRKLCLPPQ